MSTEWLKVFDRLLPRSRLWSLIYDRTIRKFFQGLSYLPLAIRDHIASVMVETFPGLTTLLLDWSRHFGYSSALTRDQLIAEWKATGGQSPAYIQEVLQNAGFDVYVHEWWVPGSDPVNPTVRNPISLVYTSRVLVNHMTTISKRYDNQFAAVTQNGNCFRPDSYTQFQFGGYSGSYLAPKLYPTPDDPEQYPMYWYICGPTWPQYAFIQDVDLETLLRLIYKMKPAHTRVILRVIALPAGDVLIDRISDPDQIQDQITDPDQIQDQI